MTEEPTRLTTLEGDMVAWGKAIVLETSGRRSGRPRRVTVGYVTDGPSLWVAASSVATHWARNLQADPCCYVELRGRRIACRAEVFDDEARDAAVVALILKYGAPAERLAGGIAFRLDPR